METVLPHALEHLLRLLHIPELLAASFREQYGFVLLDKLLHVIGTHRSEQRTYQLLLSFVIEHPDCDVFFDRPKGELLAVVEEPRSGCTCGGP
jgi:hypothetical protein